MEYHKANDDGDYLAREMALMQADIGYLRPLLTLRQETSTLSQTQELWFIPLLNNNNRGFTLIEMLITITVLAIVMPLMFNVINSSFKRAW